MTVQQVGDASTRKGDPHFMQNLNAAWKKLDGNRKNALKHCVHEHAGKVVRIDAPKNFPELEKFVRTFANGKLYIGVGAWGNSKGNAADNAQVSLGYLPGVDWNRRLTCWQSSAGHGNKDILVCYSDGDATPK